MTSRSTLWGFVCMALFLTAAAGADVLKSTVSIHAGVQGFRPGDKVPIALRIEVPEGWYTYAADPGDAGMPPGIRLQAPEGVTLGSWRFPPHQTFSDDAGTYYGYKGQVVLRNELHIPSDVTEGVALQAVFDVIWMICKDMCLPFRDQIALRLPQLAADQSPMKVDAWQALLQAGGWEEEKEEKQQAAD